MLDDAAATAFGVGFSFGLFVLVLGWSVLSVVHFAKSLLNGVSP